MDIENLLGSIGEGLRKIGCKPEKQRFIMRVLMRSEVLAAIKRGLNDEIYKAYGNHESEWIDEQIRAEKAALIREQELKAAKLFNNNSETAPFVFDISYPKKVKGGEK